jgi:hypothetical protein
MIKQIGTALGFLAHIARDPALGYRGAALTKTLSLLSQAIEKGAEIGAILGHIGDLHDSGKERELTKDEWYSLRDTAHTHLEALNPSAPEGAADSK